MQRQIRLRAARFHLRTARFGGQVGGQVDVKTKEAAMEALARSALILLSMWANPQTIQQPVSEKPHSPVVLVVGCASDSTQPHIWTLSQAGERVETWQPAITAAEKTALATSARGSQTYQLIGVADFVDTDTSRRIGARGTLLSPPRVNATGMLARGRRVAVKGLYIQGSPPRINLTSVADLGPCDGDMIRR